MLTHRPLSRPVAAAAVVTGVAGAGLAAGYAARGLLAHQAATARRVIGKPLGEEALGADRKYQRKFARRDGRRPLRLLLVGDSIAAGLGAERPKETLGARLAKRLARSTGRTVRLRTVAKVGSESSMLAAQLATLPATYRPDVAVIVVGGNDVTHRVPVAAAAADLAAAVRDLRARGAAVVVGTCPDLGALRAVPQPLRTLGSQASRRLARAQARAAVDAGAYAVSLAHVVGPVFVSRPEEMFSIDRFHPSAAGYRRTAKALLPSLLAALGSGSDPLPAGHRAPSSGV